MQAQAESEMEEKRSVAEEEAAQLIAEAEEEAQAIRARHRARVEPMLLTEAASLQNKAKLGALRATANAREQLLVEAFGRAQDCLAHLRQTPQYAEVLHVLAREALEGLNGDLVARVDPRDAALVRAAFEALGTTVEIQEQEIPLGGLELMTRDGRVIVDNTLAARLDRSRGLLRGPVAEILAEPSTSETEWTTTTTMATPA
jgi:vacuolar-type H+-ATPase subunit E/Vma4